MKEKYEWISLQYFDQDDATDQWDISSIFTDVILNQMIDEFVYAKYAYFIKHNYEIKEDGKQIYFKDDKIGFILLLLTNMGQLELRYGIIEKERGNNYIKDALIQLKEIINQNESVMDYRNNFKEKEKELLYTPIFSQAHIRNLHVNHIALQSSQYVGRNDEYNMYAFHKATIFVKEKMPVKVLELYSLDS